MIRLALMLPTVVALALLSSATSQPLAKVSTVARDAPQPEDAPLRPAMPAAVETEEDDSRDERVDVDIVAPDHSPSRCPALIGVVSVSAGVDLSLGDRETYAAPRAPPVA